MAFLFFWVRVYYILGWPHTHYIANDDLELHTHTHTRWYTGVCHHRASFMQYLGLNPSSCACKACTTPSALCTYLFYPSNFSSSDLLRHGHKPCCLLSQETRPLSIGSCHRPPMASRYTEAGSNGWHCQLLGSSKSCLIFVNFLSLTLCYSKAKMLMASGN